MICVVYHNKLDILFVAVHETPEHWQAVFGRRNEDVKRFLKKDCIEIYRYKRSLKDEKF